MPPAPRSAPRDAAPVLTRKIRDEITRSLRKRLGLSETDPLPSEMSRLIDKTAASASSSALELGLKADAEAAAKETGRAVLFDGFLDKMSAARRGIDLIGQSGDVKAILRRRAELLWAKKQALEAAGFDAESAMRIILAELSARSH